MPPTPRLLAVAPTPLGDVSLLVEGAPDATITLASPDMPRLPEGTAVDGVLLLSVRLASPVAAASPVRLRVTSDGPADSESGEHLESVAFERPPGVLQLAMRDDEWHADRGIVGPVLWEPHGLALEVAEAPAGTVIGVGVAWRAGPASSKDDVSTWIAADLVLPR